jgi:cobyrinic acid a,c-diamide synthase
MLFAGTKSGSGKTTAVCTVLSLLKLRQIKVKACKCGPDYIDPMFHRAVLDIPCTNLDPFFCDTNLLRCLLNENSGEELTVIEGVMGYYDGTGESGTDHSTYTVAEETASPVILVVDAKGASASLIAEIEGFLNYRADSRIKGVLFNRISPMNYANVTRLLNRRFGDAVIPVGYIPELPQECILPSRHLGLVTANEIADLTKRLEKTAQLCQNTIELDTLLTIANSADPFTYDAPNIPTHETIRLAAAYDDAFCFYYHDTFRLLEKMGAEIETFSPLADEPVPDDADGLLLGGGYPELYTDALEANVNAKSSIIQAIRSGMPTIAECGGFQYLGEELDGRKMCGVLPHNSMNSSKLVRFGYLTLTAKQNGLFGSAGTVLKAHEFHYWDSTDNGGDFHAVKPSGRSWDCGIMTDTLYAGYPHLFLSADIRAAENFYLKCLSYKENRT